MLNHFSWRHRLDCSGQSIVEIGLVTPFLLMALYVPVDFGIAYYTAHLTQNAVREAARIGVSTKDPFTSTAAAQVADEAMARLPARLKSVTVTAQYFSGPQPDCMQSVSVTAAGNYNFFFYQVLRLVGVTVPDSTQITRTAKMRYEFQPVTNSISGGTPPCIDLARSGQRTRS